MNSTSSVAAIAPMNAAMGTSAWEVGATAQQMAAATPAPEFTPIVPGDASGLASTLCVSAVSYTHLDVYKRQHHGLAAGEEEHVGAHLVGLIDNVVHFLVCCLLYTSPAGAEAATCCST